MILRGTADAASINCPVAPAGESAEFLASPADTASDEAGAAKVAGLTPEEKFTNQVAALAALGKALGLDMEAQQEAIADYYAELAEEVVAVAHGSWADGLDVLGVLTPFSVADRPQHSRIHVAASGRVPL